jgi:hypothetical protein
MGFKSKLDGFPKLLQKNFRAAMLHYLIMIGIFIWFWIQLNPNFQNVHVYRLKAVAPPADQPQKNQLNFNVIAKSLNYQSIPFWLMTFFAITSFAHLMYATDFWGFGFYSKVIYEGWNPFRWVEYGITASIMFFILCLLDGIRDVAALAPIVVSIAVVMGQGWIVENQLIKSMPDWTTITAATVFGWILLVTAFAVLAYTLITIMFDNKDFNNNVPAWVPILSAVELLNFTLFGVQQLRHIHMFQTDTVDFLKIESGYINFSFTAKVLLGAVLCYGLLDYQSKSN